MCLHSKNWSFLLFMQSCCCGWLFSLLSRCCATMSFKSYYVYNVGVLLLPWVIIWSLIMMLCPFVIVGNGDNIISIQNYVWGSVVHNYFCHGWHIWSSVVVLYITSWEVIMMCSAVCCSVVIICLERCSVVCCRW